MGGMIESVNFLHIRYKKVLYCIILNGIEILKG